MAAVNIEEVILELDEIIEQAQISFSPIGYFPALYRKVTIAVRDGIAADRFEDGPRMERLDVIFANRYLDAYRGFVAQDQISKSWSIAFKGTERWWPIVLQHLLVGMNAHINLDLGIAAAQTCPGESLKNLKNDFNEINNILFELVNEVQNELASIWPTLFWLDKIAGSIDEKLVRFSMDKARDAAWGFAQELAFSEKDQVSDLILNKDQTTQGLGRLVLYPGILSFIPRIIRLGEKGSVKDKITKLI